MTPEDSPDRCPTCHGIHIGHACPVELTRRPKRRITDAEDAATRAFLKRCSAGVVYKPRRQ